MTLKLKPLYGHAMAIAIAMAFTTGASVSPIGSAPAFALPEDEPKKTTPATSSTDQKKKKKKRAKQKKKQKQNFNSNSDRSSLEPYTVPSGPDLTLANAQIKAGEFRAAIVTLNGLRRLDDANVLNLLGYSHRKLGLVDVGMRYYLAALERNPQHTGVHEYLGEAYLQKDDLAKAEIMLEKLGRICGTDCKPYQELQSAIAEYKSKSAL